MADNGRNFIENLYPSLVIDKAIPTEEKIPGKTERKPAPAFSLFKNATLATTAKRLTGFSSSTGKFQILFNYGPAVQLLLKYVDPDSAAQLCVWSYTSSCVRVDTGATSSSLCAHRHVGLTAKTIAPIKSLLALHSVQTDCRPLRSVQGPGSAIWVSKMSCPEFRRMSRSPPSRSCTLRSQIISGSFSTHLVHPLIGGNSEPENEQNRNFVQLRVVYEIPLILFSLGILV